MLQFESIWSAFLKLEGTAYYLDLSITQGEQTRVDRRRLVNVVDPMSTEAYSMWWTKYCELFRPLLTSIPFFSVITPGVSNRFDKPGLYHNPTWGVTSDSAPCLTRNREINIVTCVPEIETVL
jgi:hypothetical protein